MLRGEKKKRQHEPRLRGILQQIWKAEETRKGEKSVKKSLRNSKSQGNNHRCLQGQKKEKAGKMQRRSMKFSTRKVDL